MTVTINGTTGITNDGGYTGDGVVFADTTPANTLVTTTGGNVGIGTTSTPVRLSLVDSATIGWPQSATETIPAIFRQTSSAATVVANGYKYSATANGFASGYSSSWAKSAISLSEGTVRFYTDTAAAVAVGTDVTPTERARIDSSGNLLVGATSAIYSSRMRVHGGIASTGSIQFNIDGTSATNFEWVLRLGAGMQFYVNNASVIGTLTASGVWTNASDARYKENIRPVTYGLAEVMQLQPRAYNIIGSEKQEIGFVAQEVEPLIPELVDSSRNSVTEEDRLTLSYGQMSAVLVKAIQEQQAIILAQESALNALTARVAALEGK